MAPGLQSNLKLKRNFKVYHSKMYILMLYMYRYRRLLIYLSVSYKFQVTIWLPSVSIYKYKRNLAPEFFFHVLGTNYW